MPICATDAVATSIQRISRAISSGCSSNVFLECGSGGDSQARRCRLVLHRRASLLEVPGALDPTLVWKRMVGEPEGDQIKMERRCSRSPILWQGFVSSPARDLRMFYTA